MQDIDIYYESIKQVYNQILRSQERKQPLREKIVDWLVGTSAVTFILSLIPILPVVLVFIGSHFGFNIGPLSLKQASIGKFVIVWVSSAIGTVAVLALMLWVNSKVDSLAKESANPPQTLSPEQLTFIAIYEAYKELKVYFVSHVDQHIENSLSALRRILPSARDRIEIEEIRRARRLEPAEMDMMYLDEYPAVVRSGPSSLSKQVSIAQAFLQTFEKYAWLQIDTATKSNLQALISFPDKIFYRLSKREDLPSVLSVLENLSKFSYAYLPEHKTYMDSAALEKLHSEGADCLRCFVEEVNKLTHYSQPAEQKQTKAEASLTWLDKVRKSDYANILLRFTVWFVLLLLLTTSGVYLLSQRFTLSPDTVVSLIIGTSIAGAIALTGILLRGSKSD